MSAPRNGRWWLPAVALVLAVAGSAVGGRLEAQVALGDSLWQAGNISEAQQAYLREVEQDRNAVRANFRIAQSFAWDQNTDSALVYLRQARERVPDDPDLLFSEATFLAWARRFDESLIRYDTLIAAHPEADFSYVRAARARTLSWDGRHDEARVAYEETLRIDPASREARAGLAQIDLWTGNLGRSAEGYRALLEDDPAEATSLAGLARVRLQQGRTHEAGKLLNRIAPEAVDTDVQAALDAVDRARSPSAELTGAASRDSDENLNYWQILSLSLVPVGDLRTGLTVGWLDANDPNRDASRVSAEVNASHWLGSGTISASVGMRQLRSPEAIGSTVTVTRNVPTARLSLRQRIAPTVGLGIGISHWPLDEVAVLTALQLDIDQVDASIDGRIGRLAVVGSGSYLSFSDGNARHDASGRLTLPVGYGFSIGTYGSWLGYQERAQRYFSPASFRSAEARAAWEAAGTRWSGGFGGGLGAQKIDDAAVQRQWSANGRVAYRPTERWELELTGGRSTSAAATAIGAFSYETLSLLLRRRF